MSRIVIAILIAVGALLLLYLLRPREQESQPPEPPDQAEIIEQGRFVLEGRGASLGQEDFTLEREPDGTVKLSSKITLALPRRRAGLGSDPQLA